MGTNGSILGFLTMGKKDERDSQNSIIVLKPKVYAPKDNTEEFAFTVLSKEDLDAKRCPKYEYLIP